MAALLSLTFNPIQSKAAATMPATTNATMNTEESAMANTLLSRLSEINAMDKSTMSSPEKRQLRKEVRSIKGELKVLGGGVYLSVGAIIIILLLLLILF